MESARARNNDVYVSFYPPWMHEGKVMVGLTCGDTDHSKPEPKYYFHDFTVEELVTVLDPLGNVHRLQDRMPWHFKCNWDSYDRFQRFSSRRGSWKPTEESPRSARAGRRDILHALRHDQENGA